RRPLSKIGQRGPEGSGGRGRVLRGFEPRLRGAARVEPARRSELDEIRRGGLASKRNSAMNLRSSGPMKSMSSLSSVGTCSYLPGRPYTNHDLARVMDPSDAWIQQRTGIAQRHYAPEGVGAADLALEASTRALAAAKLAPEDIDYILFATMTPDFIL